MKKIYYKKFLPTRRVKVTNFKGVSLDGYSKSLPIDYSLKQENLKPLRFPYRDEWDCYGISDFSLGFCYPIF